MISVRLGLLVYATDTGLGIQTRALYNHLKPSKIMLVDLSMFNHMPVHDDWYDCDVRTSGYPSNYDVDRFLEDLDVIFLCETPLNYYLIERARQLGVKTILQYNYEFFDYLTVQEQQWPRLPRPDVFAAPALWNIDMVRSVAGNQLRNLPVPIDVDELPQRTITSARCFFHIAGRPAVHDRNGTLDFIAAANIAARQLPDVDFVVYCQEPTPEISRAAANSPVRLEGPTSDHTSLFRHGDVLVLPRRYGGLCLPAQEAIGCGIPVLMTKIEPNTAWLPHDWLVPVSPSIEQFRPRGPVNVYRVNVFALAKRMIELYWNDGQVQAMHETAKRLAGSLSWRMLRPAYEQLIHELSPLEEVV